MASPSEQLKKSVLDQIATTETLFEYIDKNKQYPDYSGRSTDAARVEHETLCLALIERAVGRDHSYYEQALKATRLGRDVGSGFAVIPLRGIVKALKREVENDLLVPLTEIIHASVFADFREMADHLLDQGYKDPAAVLIGGVLEGHLKQLADKHGIPLEDTAPNGDLRPRKAERLNQELAKAQVYNLLEQKTVTAWLDLRNKAAHAQYGDYTNEQVELFSAGLKDFLARYPA